MPVLAALVGGWLVFEIDRQARLGIADAYAWFVVLAAAVALAVAVFIAREAQQRRMALLVLFWVAVAVGDYVGQLWPGSRLATTVLLVVLALQAPAYAHMTLAYPSGYVRDRIDRAFLVAAYAVSIAWELPPALFVDGSACRSCRPHSSSLVFTGHTFDVRPVGQTFWALFVVLGLCFLALIVRRLRTAPPGAGRTLFPLAAAGVFAAAEFIVERLAWLGDWTAPLAALEWVDDASLLVVPASMLVGVARIRRDRGPVGDLVVELGRTGPGEVRAALARAAGDPTLQLALWLPDTRTFVDEHGQVVDVDREARSRAVTWIGSESEPLAAIIHDPALVGQRPLLEAAGSAARLALENARLQAELRAQLHELQTSRSRIVEAADSERRRLERDLHDGAQQRLLALGLALQLLEDDGGDGELLREAQAELRDALRELRELARGIHPAILTERGLAAAVAALVDRSPVPVAVDVLDGRLPGQVESAVYFTVCEALANVTKHAGATRAAVKIAREGDMVVVEVEDDGAGGAVPGAGGGLQGLADRVGAVGGRLRVASPAGAGTTVRAEVPCAS